MSQGRNPFADDDDDEFLRKGSRYSTATTSVREGRWDEGTGRRWEEGTGEDPPLSRYEQLQQLQKESMNRQLQSTERCLQSIYDSEAVGIATAEELVRQGEQLDNIECKVEKINADTRVSQRHLNGIKSIFGGIKNWWSGEDKKEPTVPSKPPPRSSALQDTIEASQYRVAASRSETHPSERLKSGNTAGFYGDDDDFDSRFSARGSGASQGGAQVQKSSGRSAAFDEYEANLNKNLDVMSSGLSNLKMLAHGLNDEIVAQNDQIDRIMPKVDRADTKLKDQNRQMKQILGK